MFGVACHRTRDIACLLLVAVERNSYGTVVAESASHPACAVRLRLAVEGHVYLSGLE
jgi:hypothetical protein